MNRTLCRWLVTGLALFGSSGSSLAQILPKGPEFQVNQYSTGAQYRPAVAVGSAGDFVVVWESEGSGGTDSDGESVQARCYAADGTPLGSEFQVNTFTAGDQYHPAVARNGQGRFVVVWESWGSSGSDTNDTSIQARRFDAGCSPLGGELQVNSFTSGYQRFPRAAMDASGKFVVVWGSQGSSGSDTDGTSIQAQRFDLDGTPLGGEVQVNSYTTSIQDLPAVAFDGQGRFVVVWTSFGSGGGDDDWSSIQGQRFDAAGGRVGGEFQVNSYTTQEQTFPAVAADDQGRFAVAWQSLGSGGSDTSYWSVQARRFDSGGTPQGGDFQVNRTTLGYQYRPALAMDGQGDFVVAWDNRATSSAASDGDSIQAQLFAGDGTPLGGELQVNTYTTGLQSFPAVAVGAAGDLVLAWDSRGSLGGDSSSLSVQARRFSGVLFYDGFESGDTSRWSSTSP
jgi:hypothetical protein